MEKHRYYYYYDERRDDFANNGIDGKPTPADFEYFPKNIFFRFCKVLVYSFFCIFLLDLATLFSVGYRVHNTKVLRNRRDRKKGYFVFANHTSWMGDAIVHQTIARPRPAYVVVNPDAISIPFVGTLLRMLGVMPNPSSSTTYKRFIEALESIYNHGNSIIVYPEAHIWPKYNGVRDFDDVSFHLPVKLDAPCFVKSTIYKKDKRGHTHATIWYDGPFYPDQNLHPKQAQKDLRDRVYAQMCERCKDSELDCRYHYEKVDSPELVRSEFKEV